MTAAYPCCRHCTHGPDFVHNQPCQSLIYEGEHCQTGTGWWGVYLRKLADEQLDRQTWIDTLALDWGLIRMPESLTPAQLTAQIDMHLRQQSLKFYPTTPMPGFMIRVGDQGGAEIIFDNGMTGTEKQL